MEEVRNVMEEANNALVKSLDGLDMKLRPVQRAFFQCALAVTSDDKAPASVVGAGIGKCQEPLTRVHGLLNEAQEAFQGRMVHCHELAGETLDPNGPARQGKPTPEEMRKYAAALRTCVQKEVGGIDTLVAPVYAAVPTAQKDIEAAMAGGKKGWF